MYILSYKDWKDYNYCETGMHVRGVKRNKNKHNRFDLTHLFLMLKVSKVLHTIYINSIVLMLKVSKVMCTIYIQYIYRMKPLLCTHT